MRSGSLIPERIRLHLYTHTHASIDSEPHNLPSLALAGSPVETRSRTASADKATVVECLATPPPSYARPFLVGCPATGLGGRGLPPVSTPLSAVHPLPPTQALFASQIVEEAAACVGGRG